MSRQRNAWTQRDDAALIQGFKQRLSIYKIAKILGRDDTTCRRHAIALGLIKPLGCAEFDGSCTPVQIEDLTVRSCTWSYYKDGDHIGYCGAVKSSSKFCEIHSELPGGERWYEQGGAA